jgi:hypothetical protein
MGLRPTQGDENAFCPATALHGSVRAPLCHPERSRGICSSADHSWKCFSTERTRISCHGIKLSSFPLCGLSVHILVGHAEQIPQHLRPDTVQPNQYAIEIEVVVRDVVHQGIRSEQFSAVIEIYSDHKRAGLGRRIRRHGCQ